MNIEPEILDFLSQEIEGLAKSYAIEIAEQLPHDTPAERNYQLQLAKLVQHAFIAGADVTAQKLEEAQDQCIN